MKSKTIDYYNFRTGEHELIDTEKIENSGKVMEGHGGGDLGIVNVLYQYLTEGYEGDLLSEIEISAQNHMIAFAAERSRLENRVVDLAEFGV